MVLSELPKLDAHQKSCLNTIVLQLLQREINAKEYMEEAANSDCVLASLAFFLILLMKQPDLREVSVSDAKSICLVMSNFWTLNSSQIEHEGSDDSIPFYIMKVCDLLYSYENDFAKSSLVGTKRRSLLLDFGWNNPHIAVYKSFPEFWIKLISMSSSLYKSDPALLQWAIKNINLHIDENFLRSREPSRPAIGQESLKTEDGFYDPTAVALTGNMSQEEDFESPTTLTMSTIKEASLREVCRWKIYSGDDMDKINKFCKTASLKFHLKAPLVHKVLIGLEDLFLYKVKFQRNKVKLSTNAPLVQVFQYLDAMSGLNLTLVSRAFRVAYRLPHLRSVLVNCILPQPVRMAIWMQFLSSVGHFLQ